MRGSWVVAVGAGMLVWLGCSGDDRQQTPSHQEEGTGTPAASTSSPTQVTGGTATPTAPGTSSQGTPEGSPSPGLSPTNPQSTPSVAPTPDAPAAGELVWRLNSTEVGRDQGIEASYDVGADALTLYLTEGRSLTLQLSGYSAERPGQLTCADLGEGDVALLTTPASALQSEVELPTEWRGLSYENCAALNSSDTVVASVTLESTADRIEGHYQATIVGSGDRQGDILKADGTFSAPLEGVPDVPTPTPTPIPPPTPTPEPTPIPTATPPEFYYHEVVYKDGVEIERYDEQYKGAFYEPERDKVESFSDWWTLSFYNISQRRIGIYACDDFALSEVAFQYLPDQFSLGGTVDPILMCTDAVVGNVEVVSFQPVLEMSLEIVSVGLEDDFGPEHVVTVEANMRVLLD